MLLRPWLRSLRSIRRSSRRSTRRSRGFRAAAQIERLEDRTLLSALSGWAFGVEGTDSAAPSAVHVDADSNIYVGSSFQGTADFDPGPGVFNLTALGGARGDGFIARYTQDHELVWARSFGGDSNDERVTQIASDAAGNVYVAGHFASSTAYFGSITLTNERDADDTPVWDAYIAKLDSNGNFLWAHNFGDVSNDFGWDISVSDAGDVLAAGSFSGQVDFDPDPDNSVILTSAGSRDAVVWKLDTNGQLQWVRSFGGSGSDEAYRVATDAAGDIYVTGPFHETVDFGNAGEPIPFSSATPDAPDTFILKLDPSGATVWARQVTGSGIVGASRLALGASGSVYTSGWFDGTAEFGNGAATLSSSSERDAYVARWDADGTFLWAAQFTATGHIKPERLLVDAAESVYMVGRFRGTADLDPSAGSEFQLTTADTNWDGLLVRLDSSGNFVAGYHTTGPGFVRADDVAADAAGNLYAVGSFASSVAFPTGDALASGGSPVFFVNRLDLAPGITVAPASGLVTTESGGTETFGVVLNSPPTADVSIALTSDNPGEGSVSPASLTFTPGNWNIPQTVTVAGVDDDAVDGDVQYSIVTAAAVSADGHYGGLNAADVTVTNLDDEVPAGPATKFFVVDASAQGTFEYGADGTLVESYALGSGNTAPRGAAADATGERVWVIANDDSVYVYDQDGNTLGSWWASGLSRPEGIASDGENIWIVDRGTDRVYFFGGAASRLSGSASADSSFALNRGNRNPYGVTTDGSHLWVVNSARNDEVFYYSTGGALLGSWRIDGSNRMPTGITIDPVNVSDIWIVDGGTDRVYRYQGAAARTSGSQSASESFSLAAGNSDPQGIADPPASAAAPVESSQAAVEDRHGRVSGVLPAADSVENTPGSGDVSGRAADPVASVWLWSPGTPAALSLHGDEGEVTAATAEAAPVGGASELAELDSIFVPLDGLFDELLAL